MTKLARDFRCGCRLYWSVAKRQYSPNGFTSDRSTGQRSLTLLDLLLRNAKVLTMDDRRPRARTVGVLHGRIVGLDDEVNELAASSVIDCAGSVLVPGF